MLELIALIGIASVGLSLLAAFALLGLLFKVAFKILLLPFFLLGGLFKLAFSLIAFVVLLFLGIVAAPIILAVLLALSLPLLLVGGVVGLGWALAT